jgi:hypothetical protein
VVSVPICKEAIMNGSRTTPDRRPWPRCDGLDRLYLEAEAFHEFLQMRFEETERAPRYHRMLGEAYGRLTAYLDHGDVEHAMDRRPVERSATRRSMHTAWVQVAYLLQTFVQDLDTPARMNLVDSLAQIFTRYDQPQLADHLRSIATQVRSANGRLPSSPPRRGIAGEATP